MTLQPTTQIPERFKRPKASSSLPDRFTGQLYQLSGPRALHVGAYVVVDGPHDTFGVVLAANRKEAPGSSESYLHLIRGIRRNPEFTPVMMWPN